MLRKIKMLNRLKTELAGLEILMDYFPEIAHREIIQETHDRIRTAYNIQRYWFMPKAHKIA